ncbi:MAG: ribonucleoside-triphosphate reductase, adenosylcobalamin-dependent, partial [Halanaerobiales bacterium]
WNVKPEVGQDPENPKTVVIEFPIKAPKGKVKKDVSAIEQLETYKMFMENYVDHNASITVHVKDNEWDEVEEWMWNNWDTVVGISFISLDDSFYDLMPYEEITKEEYEKMVEDMEDFKPYIVNYYEKMSNERELGNLGCETGVCPVR